MAQSPWGDLPVNDAHVHFFSHSFYSGLARQKKLAKAEDLGGLLNWAIPAPDPVALGRSWISEMDRHNVKRACLIASAHGDEASVAAAASAFPDRFYGYFMLDPTQPDAMQRAERASTNRYLAGICLFPAMHTYSITDARVVPILELASDHGLAVFVHCGTISIGVRQKLGLPSQFNMQFSNPLDLHAVALHFPRVPFVVPHFGAGLLREALMIADLCPNVYLDTSSSNRWMAYEGLDLRTVFRRAIEVAGLDRLLFGTDSSFFPRGWNSAIFDAQATALYELGYDQQQITGIFGGNLDRLLESRRPPGPVSENSRSAPK
ncbi:MAG TPA: amidohydrolase family protein [Bryobacteraceae bacterium]|nr:amidohydrolase family protein [Bryobacteraceae bacterium]